MTIGSLFSGIGGLDLGLELAGLGPVVWQCEIDPFCRAVLAKHWPNVTKFEDATRPRDWPHADLVCGGFPCQDVSSAGKRRGIGGERSGRGDPADACAGAGVVMTILLALLVLNGCAYAGVLWVCPIGRGALRREAVDAKEERTS